MADGITGKIDPNSGLFVFSNGQNRFGGFVLGGSAGGVRTGASRALRTLLLQLNGEIGQTFVDRINPDGSVTSEFAAITDGSNQVFMRLDVRMGSSGNYVAVFGDSTFDDQSELSAVVSQMTRSVAFSN